MSALSDRTNAVPDPGTDEALAAGCTCPVIDNRYGRGYLGQAGVFVYTCGCPVHAPTILRALEASRGGER